MCVCPCVSVFVCVCVCVSYISIMRTDIDIKRPREKRLGAKWCRSSSGDTKSHIYNTRIYRIITYIQQMKYIL